MPGAVDTTGTTDRASDPAGAYGDRGGKETFANASPAAGDFPATPHPPPASASRPRR